MRPAAGAENGQYRMIRAECAAGRGFRRGMTLVELLIVVMILAAMSGMVVTMTDNLDRQSRYEQTITRLDEIRLAILGPSAVAPNGTVFTGGFLQDTGWLPDTAADLLRPPIINGVEMCSYRYDPDWKTWYGWRGPYVKAPPVRAGDTIALYDGWGFDFTGWPEHLWDFDSFRNLTDIKIGSLGSDNRPDSGNEGPYEKDFPDNFLIARNEWYTPVRYLSVTVENSTGDTVALSDFRIRIIIPRWDLHPDSPIEDEPVDAYFMSEISSLDVPGKGKTVLEVEFVENPKIPHGQWKLFLVDQNGKKLSHEAWADFCVTKMVAPVAKTPLVIR